MNSLNNEANFTRIKANFTNYTNFFLSDTFKWTFKSLIVSLLHLEI
jgi:hypothetical protein